MGVNRNKAQEDGLLSRLTSKIPQPLRQYLALALFFGGLGVYGIFKSTGWSVGPAELLSLPFWRETPCRIGACKPDLDWSRKTPYGIRVLYHYEVKGKTYSSKQVRIANEEQSRYAEIQRLLLEYPPGSESMCYVSPFDPTQACLRRMPGETAQFCLIGFGLGCGAVALILIWKPKSKLRGKTPAADPDQEDEREAIRFNAIVLCFAVAMAVFLWSDCASAFSRVLRLKQMIPTPCRVVHAGQQTADWAFPEREDVLYEYQFGGNTLSSNGFEPVPPLMRKVDATRQTVAGYAVGSQQTCYVDPERPWEAVLVPEVRPIHYPYLALFPFVMAYILFGGGWEFWRLLYPKEAKPKTKPDPSLLRPHCLSPLTSRWVTLAQFLVTGGGFICGGCVWLITILVRKGFWGWLGTGALAVVLLLTLYAVLNEVIRFLSPMPMVRFRKNEEPEEPMRVSWTLADPMRRVSGITVEIEARVPVRDKNGEETKDMQQVWHHVAADADERQLAVAGHLDLAFPPPEDCQGDEDESPLTWVVTLRIRQGNWWGFAEQFKLPLQTPAGVYPLWAEVRAADDRQG